MSEKLLMYGARQDAIQIEKTLDHMFQTNRSLQESGGQAIPICIWGKHGIGKTQLVQEYAEKHNWKFAYCSPAQFEEMGDLHGMPVVVDPDPKIKGDEYTIFAPPEWVPTEEGPGILMLDDLNRADDRILRGVMQLLQNFELFSWQLPKFWQIVATANPEGGDYSVTPMDDAMITRMMHITMEFDPKAWAKWAYANNIDDRGIAYTLTYPESITGVRTTPRTITQFFSQIKRIKDLKAEKELVATLAQSALDEVTVASFMSFVNDNMESLINPEDIVECKDFDTMKKKLADLSGNAKDGKRVDRLATICTRLYIYLTSDSYKPTPNHPENIINFILLDLLPNDLRFSLHKDLVNNGGDKLKEILKDKRLAMLLLDGM